MIPRDSYEIIDTLIKQGRSFAIWRIPGEVPALLAYYTT